MGIEKKLNEIPTAPGVYLFRDNRGTVLYIGKAANLRNRVKSYFQKRYHPPKVAALISQIEDLDYITTHSSAEALIYESNLIKEKRPKYNSELKDDKSYPYLKLTTSEKFPRLFITRKKLRDGALYYGPYTNTKLLKKALAVIRNIFLLRSCVTMPKKACLKAHIQQCVAPCDGSTSVEDYGKIVEEVKLFLAGRKDRLLRELADRMKEASKRLDYERAMIVRDKIEALSTMWRQRKSPPPLRKEIDQLKRTLNLPIVPAPTTLTLFIWSTDTTMCASLQ